MIIKFISEEHPDGIDVDFPAVPRVGDFVQLKYQAGAVLPSVERVQWDIMGGLYAGVEVYLTY